MVGSWWSYLNDSILVVVVVAIVITEGLTGVTFFALPVLRIWWIALSTGRVSPGDVVRSYLWNACVPVHTHMHIPTRT